MTTTTLGNPDDLHRIADALERIANHLDNPTRTTDIHVNLSGNHAGTKEQLAKTITTSIKDAITRGQIPPNWAA